MKTLAELLAKLDKLTYIGEDSKALQTEEGFKVSLHTKFHWSKTGRSFPSVQVIMHVHYKGEHIKHWGCDGENDTRLVVDFFLEKKNLAEVHNNHLESATKSEGSDIFNKL